MQLSTKTGGPCSLSQDGATGGGRILGALSGVHPNPSKPLPHETEIALLTKKTPNIVTKTINPNFLMFIKTHLR